MLFFNLFYVLSEFYDKLLLKSINELKAPGTSMPLESSEFASQVCSQYCPYARGDGGMDDLKHEVKYWRIGFSVLHWFLFYISLHFDIYRCLRT